MRYEKEVIYKCFHPIYIPSQKMFVNCYHCNACRTLRAERMASRVTESFKDYEYIIFGTATYNNSNLPYYELVDDDTLVSNRAGFPVLSLSDIKEDFPNIRLQRLGAKKILKHHCPRDLSKAFKDLNKAFNKKYGYKEKQFSYFFCSEYGKKAQRPHYHFIVGTSNSTFFKYFEEKAVREHTFWKFCDNDVFTSGGFFQGLDFKVISSTDCVKYITQYSVSGFSGSEIYSTRLFRPSCRHSIRTVKGNFKASFPQLQEAIYRRNFGEDKQSSNGTDFYFCPYTRRDTSTVLQFGSRDLLGSFERRNIQPLGLCGVRKIEVNYKCDISPSLFIQGIRDYGRIYSERLPVDLSYFPKAYNMPLTGVFRKGLQDKNPRLYDFYITCIGARNADTSIAHFQYVQDMVDYRQEMAKLRYQYERLERGEITIMQAFPSIYSEFPTLERFLKDFRYNNIVEPSKYYDYGKLNKDRLKADFVKSPMDLSFKKQVECELRYSSSRKNHSKLSVYV